MNNLIIPISDLSYSVERPVVFDIVRQLMDITEISSKTPIKFLGDDLRALQADSSIDDDKTSISNNWPFSERVYIEITEDFEFDRILQTPVIKAENLFIFKDENIGVNIRPVYGSSKITVTFKYRAPDKNKADMWRNTLKTRVSMGREMNLHKVSYSYHLPNDCIVILNEIHRLREKKAGYNESFQKYLNDHFNNKVSIVSTQNGKSSHYQVSETQTRIQGVFEFEGVPDKPEKESDGSAYVVTVNYHFTYDKPTHVNMIHPYVVHNQVINRRFRELSRPLIIETTNRSYSLSTLNFSKFEDGQEILDAYGNKGLNIPLFDYSFIPGSIPSGSVRIATVLCSVDENNPRDLFNLKNLGDFNIHPDILEMMASEHAYLHKSYMSLFCVQLYENEILKAFDSLKIDKDLNVTSTFNLDLRKTYRVRISMIADFDLLWPDAKKRMKRYGMLNNACAIRIANALNAILRDIGANKDINKTRLTDWDLVDLGVKKSPFDPSSNRPVDINNPMYNQNQVSKTFSQTLFVVAERYKEK